MMYETMRLILFTLIRYTSVPYDELIGISYLNTKGAKGEQSPPAALSLNQDKTRPGLSTGKLLHHLLHNFTSGCVSNGALFPI
jgi:hypothetical protein